MTVAILSHPDCALHDMGHGHPERPARHDAIATALQAAPFAAELCHVGAPLATREQLTRVHDPGYVDAIFRNRPKRGFTVLDPDTRMNPHSLQAALRAAGAAVHAVDLVLGDAGDVGAAFANVRPPGHHAERALAMGFCLFDNVAVGAAHALAAHGLERVAIVDFDVHHGNGTEDIFRDDPRVMLCSSFQHPFYPMSGADTVSDHILNLPLSAGTGSAAYRTAAAERWFAALERFRPELVMFSAGFDAHRDDPLAELELGEEDYGWLTREVKAATAAHAGGRCVSMLEGGYDLQAIGRSACAHVDALRD